MYIPLDCYAQVICILFRCANSVTFATRRSIEKLFCVFKFFYSFYIHYFETLQASCRLHVNVHVTLELQSVISTF